MQTKDYNEKIKQKTLRHIQAHSSIFRHIHAYSEIIQAYSGIFRTLCNLNIFGTLVHSKSETKAYSEPYQISRMEPFAKLVNDYISFSKKKKISQYQLVTFFTLLNKILFFTREVVILYKNVYWSSGPEAVDFDITTLCCNFLFIVAS